MAVIEVPKPDALRIVIVGGGFGGIELAKNLKNKPYQLVLIDQNNYHTFQPLLYQVATAGLEPDSIAFPLRKIFKNQKNIYIRMAKANAINASENILETSIGDIKYDYLVIATGSTTNFFGLQQIQQVAMPMKSIVEALDLRSQVLQSFEKALLTNNLIEQEALMSFAVVGGGATGVEMAGALIELKNHVLHNDYPELDLQKMQVHLIEASANILGTMQPKNSQKSLKFLENMGVKVWLNSSVTSYDGNSITLNNNKTITTKTLIWAAGVQGNTLQGIDNKFINKGKRITVDNYNKVIGYQNIYAIGDVACMTPETHLKGHPMVAPVAIQQGKLLAKNFINLQKNKPLQTFSYFDKGSMATIGRNRAVLEYKTITMQGIIAWFAWMAVHLMTLVGFRNKLVTFVNWLWSYLNYDRGIRLIIRPYTPTNNTSPQQISN